MPDGEEGEAVKHSGAPASGGNGASRPGGVRRIATGRETPEGEGSGSPRDGGAKHLVVQIVYAFVTKDMAPPCG